MPQRLALLVRCCCPCPASLRRAMRRLAATPRAMRRSLSIISVGGIFTTKCCNEGDTTVQVTSGGAKSATHATQCVRAECRRHRAAAPAQASHAELTLRKVGDGETKLESSRRLESTDDKKQPCVLHSVLWPTILPSACPASSQLRAGNEMCKKCASATIVHARMLSLHAATKAESTSAAGRMCLSSASARSSL